LPIDSVLDDYGSLPKGLALAALAALPLGSALDG
jgi:hypothetical protein